MSEAIIKAWLTEIVQTAEARDYAGHMDLISRQVSLYGVPGYETIGYDDWYRQVQHEFENKVIQDIQYAGLKITEATEQRIMFRTFETVRATDGKVNAQGVEIILGLEGDGRWRMIQERILTDDETANDGLLPA